MNTLEAVCHTDAEANAYAVTLTIEFQEATWTKRVANGWEVWAGPTRPRSAP